MTQRREVRTRLMRAPIVLVLGEIRFLPILKIESLIPELQEQMRDLGLLNFKELMTHEIVFTGEDEPRFKSTPRWIFADRARENFAVLTVSSIAFQTISYIHFEDFVRKIEQAAALIADAVPPIVTTRVGLRYVNAISPEGELGLRDYLQPSLRGFQPEELHAGDLLWRLEAIGRIPPCGEIQVRLFQNEDGSILPPDIAASDVESGDEPSDDERATLDIDCVWQEEQDFDLKSITDILWKLHDFAERAFLATVTPPALEVWGEVRE